LALESKAVESAALQAHAQSPETPAEPPDEAFHFRIETDKAGQPKVAFLEGNQPVKVVAFNLQGFNALIEQGFMRKPQTLKVGAFHDWVELDGELFRLKDPNGSESLEQRLNQNYIAAAQRDTPQDVAVFANPASPTGFDIQFPASPNGIGENRRYHLNEQSIELLQDPHKCRVLRNGITARLIPPTLIFKVKLPDGGERPLDAHAVVSVPSESGEPRMINLSEPVDLLHLGASELTAVLNHPAVNKRAKFAEQAGLKSA
jgi:hypothetical protein